MQQRVLIVCRSWPHVLALSHVLQSIDLFAGLPPGWTIESAAAQRLVRLMDQLLEGESSRVPMEFRLERRLQGIDKAAALGSVEVLEWWASTYMGEPCTVSNVAVRDAVHYGHLPALQWLLPRWHYTNLSVECDSPEMAYWLYEHRVDVPIRLRVDLNAVASVGDLAFMQWIEKHRSDLAQVTWSPRVLSIASDRGDLAMVQWLLEDRMKNYRFAEEYLSAFAQQAWQPCHRNEPVVRYTVTTFAMPTRHNGHLQLIRWLSSDYKWKDTDTRSRWVQKATEYAAILGDAELIQMVEDSEPASSSVGDRYQATLWLAAYHGNLATVQWLHERGGRLDGYIMDAAAAGGHVQILQWVLDIGDGRIRHNKAMHAAVCAEQPDAIDWLLRNRSAWTNADNVMDLAAARGELKLLKLLHRNHVVGCTSKSMDNAAREGHLAVVQWLATNRSGGCSAKALQLAVARGHVAVAQFLHDQYSHFVTVDIMKEAVLSGHVKMVRWVDSKRSFAWPSSSLLHAAAAGHVDIVAFFVQQHGMKFDRAYLDSNSGQFAVVAWVYEHVESAVSV